MKPYKNRALLGVAVVVAAVMGLAYLGLRMQAEARTRYLTERHQRAVATLADQIGAKMEGQVAVFMQAVRSAKLRQGGRSPDLRKVDEFQEVGLHPVGHSTPSSPPPPETIDLKMEMEASLEAAGVRSLGLEAEHEAGGCESAHRSATSEDAGLVEISFCRRATPFQTDNRIRPATTTAAVGETAYVASALRICFWPGTSEKDPVCGRAELDRLLGSTVSTSSLAGADVVLLDPTGRVRYARGSNGVRLLSWPGPLREPLLGSAGALPRPSPDATGSEWPTFERLQARTHLSQVSIEGARLHLLAHPVGMTLDPAMLEGDLRSDPTDHQRANGASSVRFRSRVIATSAEVDTSYDQRGLGAASENWVVVALLPPQHIESRASAVSALVMALIGWAALIVLVIPPILKVWTVGPRDRMRPTDVHLLAAASICLIGILTIGALSVATFGILRERDDRLLRDDAKSIGKKFVRTTLAAHRKLGKFISETRHVRGRGDFHEDDLLECSTTTKRTFRCIAVAKSHAKFVPPKALDASTRVDLESGAPGVKLSSIVVVDEHGHQIEKWAAGKRTTAQTNMRSLGAVSDVRTERFLRIGGTQRNFSFNVQASRNTARRVALVSMPLDERGAANTDSVQLIASAPPPASDTPQDTAIAVFDLDENLPATIRGDRQIALVKSDGDVLFHSARDRPLFENFLAECTDRAELEAALAARKRVVLDADYHGSAQRIALAPVRGTPYVAVAMRDKERLRTLAFEVVGTSIGGLAIAVLVILGSASLFVGLRDRRAAAWTWPRRRRAEAYVGPIVAMTLLALLSMRSILVSGSASAVITTIAAGVLALAILFLRVHWLVDRQSDDPSHAPAADAPVANRRQAAFAMTLGAAAALAIVLAGETALQRILSIAVLGCCIAIGAMRSRASETETPKLLERRFVLSFTLLALLTAVLPATAVFRDAFEHATDRRAALPLHERRVACKQSYVSKKDEHRCDTDIDKPVTSSKPRTPSKKPDVDWCAQDVAPGLLGSSLSSVCRVADKIVAATTLPLWLGRTAAPAGEGHHPVRITAAVLDYFPIVNDEGIQLRSVPRQDRQDGEDREDFVATLTQVGALPFLLLLAAVVPAGWLYVRAIARKVVGIDVPTHPVEGCREKPAAERAGGELWLDPSATEIAQWRDAAEPRTLVVDFRTLTCPSEIRRTIRRDLHFAESVRVLHLEHRIDETDWNAARLELLEAVLFAQPPKVSVVVLSEIDVLTYFAGRLRSPGDPADEQNFLSSFDLDRWTTVWSRLAKLRADDRCPPEPSDALHRTIEAECRYTSRLRGIGLEMLDHPPPKTSSSEEILRDLGDRAYAHYRMLWSSCTDEERLVLLHLARDGFVSPRAWDIVRRLLERRLVRWNPSLQLMNESFRQFVTNVEDERVVRRWEAADGLSSWRKVQLGLVGVFVLVGVFLYLTRPDQLTGVLAFVTAIGGGAITLLQIVGLLRSSRIDFTPDA